MPRLLPAPPSPGGKVVPAGGASCWSFLVDGHSVSWVAAGCQVFSFGECVLADPWYQGPWRRLRPLIYERDDGVCGLCGGQVNPDRFHVDHIRPVGEGGDWFDPANLRLAHPACNLKRKHKRRKPTFRKASRIGPSREW